MGYPEKLLSDDEVIVSEFRPHWSGIIREGLILVAALVAIGFLVAFDAVWWLSLIVLLAGIFLTIRGLVRWFSTLHVITNERVIYRTGLIAKHGKEIPLEVINDVTFSQRVYERLLGTGDLLIESAGTHGQSRYQDIPRPEAVQTMIYEQREDRMARLRQDTGGAAPASESTASQLATLSRLHDEGKLTDEEFAAEKKRLLGSG